MRHHLSRLTLAINPASGSGRGEARAREAAALLRGHGLQVRELRRGSAAELTAALGAVLPDSDAVIAVGGDGLVNLVANVLAGTPIPMGIIPTGTGNDAAELIGMPADSVSESVEALMAALAEGPRRIDLGRVDFEGGRRYFVAVASAGFDSRVNERANAWRWPRGSSKYTLAMLRELVTFRPIPYELTVDGQDRSQSAMLVSVANGPSFGGGMKVAPGARVDDGLLDLVVVRPLSVRAFLAVFPKVFRGDHEGHPAVELSRGRTVSLGGPGVVVYADGERVAEGPVTMTAVPAALSVLARPGVL